VSEGKLLPLRRTGGAVADLSDDALIAAVGVGDMAALGALYDRHADPAFRFVARMIGDASAVDDLVQATFIEVQKCARKFRGKSSVRTWILGIAANLARHHVRTDVRRRAFLSTLATQPAARPAGPDDSLVTQESLARLTAGLAALRHDLRAAFLLCDVEQLGGIEAARALGVREGTLYRWLFEARRALRASIEGGSIK
jgi:RNA polymerase sigma-70 factor (ECF subfamily)